MSARRRLAAWLRARADSLDPPPPPVIFGFAARNLAAGEAVQQGDVLMQGMLKESPR